MQMLFTVMWAHDHRPCKGCISVDAAGAAITHAGWVTVCKIYEYKNSSTAVKWPCSTLSKYQIYDDQIAIERFCAAKKKAKLNQLTADTYELCMMMSHLCIGYLDKHRQRTPLHIYMLHDKLKLRHSTGRRGPKYTTITLRECR